MIKHILFKIKRKLGIQKTTEYLDYLRSLGMKIGKNTVLFSKDIYIDEQRPWMIEIGEYCKITKGVTILQHDYSRSVLRRVYGDIVGESKKTYIGNNVFIGMNSIILMGANIGHNVIIGAGSVVSGSIPDNVIVAGNPAKIIKTLDEHYHARKEKYIDEAKITFEEFYTKYKRVPTIAEMGSFWPLFLEKNRDEVINNNIFTNLSGDDEEDIIEKWLNSKSIYQSYEEFKNDCKINNIIV